MRYVYTIRIHTGSRHETLLQPFRCFEFYEVNLPLARVSNVSIFNRDLVGGLQLYSYSAKKRSLRCKQAYSLNKILYFRDSGFRFEFLNLETIHKVGIFEF